MFERRRGDDEAGRRALRAQGTPTLGGVARQRSGTVGVTPPAALGAGLAAYTAEITLLGVRPGDHLVLSPPEALEDSLTYNGHIITGRDTLKVRFTNHSAGAVTGAALDWNFSLSRERGG